MATPSNIIHLPKPSKDAYNPNRPLSKNALIKSQVEHFYEADQNLPPELRTGIDIATVTTEGEAAKYIRRVTHAIHEGGGRQEKIRKAT
jgi:hypothetical protein